jgi:4-hydroxy-2-oxoglutarate aldolase
MDARLRGIFPPIPTVFTSSGDVDPARTASNVSRWMATGLSGVLALGSNGEATSLDESESDRVVAAVRDAVPRSRLLIAGTGRESTRATIDACRRAGALGADLVLVRPPSYFKNQMTNEALIAHFRQVADASPVPILLYNLPATGVTLTLPVVSAMAQHPNVAGMKETSPELERLGQFTAIGGRFRVLSGWAPVIFPAISIGAAGGILAVANVLPDECVTLFQLASEGRHADALTLQRTITPLARLVSSVHGIAGLKHALDLIGYAGGEPRSPLRPLADGPRHEIAQALEAFRHASHAAAQ